MATFNRVILAGNLTRDPEIKYTSSGQAICNFGLAINNGKDKQGKERPVDFFDCEAWEKLAETVSEYLSKGSGVLIEGRLKQERWEDEHGAKRSRIKIVAQGVQFLSKGDGSGKSDDNKEENIPPF